MSRLSWHDLAGMAVGVFGYGVEGRASVAKLASMGLAPAVIVDDGIVADAPVPIRKSGAGGLEELARCDVVIKAPGISRYRHDVAALAGAGVEIVGGLGLWIEETDRSRVIGVTGTKGKSTTAGIIAHLLAGLGRAAFLGGNIGRPPYLPGSGAEEADVVVLEISSYQALDLTAAPAVVTLTSLSPDHLDWHGSVERYYADKLSLVELPGLERVVANGEDPVLAGAMPPTQAAVEWVRASSGALWREALGLRGRHNAMNALLAQHALLAAGVEEAADEERLARAAAGFAALPHRLQTVATRSGVEFVDDSLATNALPTIAALEAFEDRPVALLVGGNDRGIDYAPLAEALNSRRGEAHVVTMPTNGPRIAAALEGLDKAPTVASAGDLGEAVRLAYAWARPRTAVVLLSPAAPSHDRFTSYEERSAAFLAAIGDLD